MISFTDFIKISQKNKLLTVYKELFLNTTFFSSFFTELFPAFQGSLSAHRPHKKQSFLLRSTAPQPFQSGLGASIGVRIIKRHSIKILDSSSFSSSNIEKPKYPFFISKKTLKFHQIFTDNKSGKSFLFLF